MKNVLSLTTSWKIREVYLRNCVAKTVAVGALPVFAFALSVGTGGLSTSDFFLARGEIGYRNPHIVLRNTEHQYSLSSAENLNVIFKLLHLNHSELARTLNVSRQTIYNWIDGENISFENSEKLANLASVAELFVGFNQRKIRDLLRRKLNGVTVLEAAAQGHSAITFAKQLISIATREEAQRIRLAQRLLDKPNKENLIDQFGTPHLSEQG
jgi:DNA-binding XRE family transcriptional regulator